MYDVWNAVFLYRMWFWDSSTIFDVPVDPIGVKVILMDQYPMSMNGPGRYDMI